MQYIIDLEDITFLKLYIIADFVKELSRYSMRKSLKIFIFSWQYMYTVQKSLDLSIVENSLKYRNLIILSQVLIQGVFSSAKLQ